MFDDEIEGVEEEEDRHATVTVGKSVSSDPEGSRSGVSCSADTEREDRGQVSEIPAWTRARVVALIAAGSIPRRISEEEKRECNGKESMFPEVFER